ncbi:MAG: hypothetical protein QXG00_08205 [Candidatus Woesearchaeota archaeon]
MNFKEYYFKEIYSQWIYKVQDPYTAIYDFYAMSLINPDNITDEDLAFGFKQAKKTIIDYEKEFLLNQIAKGVTSEVSYYLHFQKPEALKDYIPKYLKNAISKSFFKDYVKEFGLDDKGQPRINHNGKLVMRTLIPVYADRFEEAYKMTLDFMKKRGYSLADLLMFSKEAFGDISGWKSDQYGGKAWVTITQAGLDIIDLKNETDFNKTMAVLDHVFDLQHNTGSIFSKNEHLDKLRINDILNDKRDIKNVMGYYNRVSDGLKGPLAAAIKDLYGKTVESEREDIELEDMINNVKRNPLNIKHIKNPPIEVQRAAIETDPVAVTYIDNPDIDIVKKAIEKDSDIFKMLNPNIKNKLPKKFVQDLFGSFDEPDIESEPKKKVKEFIDI